MLYVLLQGRDQQSFPQDVGAAPSRQERGAGQRGSIQTACPGTHNTAKKRALMTTAVISRDCYLRVVIIAMITMVTLRVADA